MNGEFKIIKGQKESLKRILKEDPKIEIDKMSNIIIDDVYIESVMKQIPPNLRLQARASLEEYKGKSLKEALDLHAFKLNED